MSVYHCYTDGACSNNGKKNAVGAWAFVIVDNDGDIVVRCADRVTELPTNNRMEMMAIINCCNYCKQFLYDKDNVNEFIIYTDSYYCQGCYNEKWYVNWQRNNWKNAWRQDVVNQDLWKQLIPYYDSPRFMLNKVKAHANDKWNNYVDKLAVATIQGGTNA